MSEIDRRLSRTLSNMTNLAIIVYYNLIFITSYTYLIFSTLQNSLHILQSLGKRIWCISLKHKSLIWCTTWHTQQSSKSCEIGFTLGSNQSTMIVCRGRYKWKQCNTLTVYSNQWCFFSVSTWQCSIKSIYADTICRIYNGSIIDIDRIKGVVSIFWEDDLLSVGRSAIIATDDFDISVSTLVGLIFCILCFSYLQST